MIYLDLLIVFLKIGLLSFGGGYAALPLIEDLIVHQQHWLTMEEYTHLITISQMTPGPIAINASTFIGTKIGGLPGAIIATVGCVLPSIIIVTLLARLYKKYQQLDLMQNTLLVLKPVVVALIASSGISILTSAIWGAGPIDWYHPQWLMVGLFVLCLVILRRYKTNPIVVMLGAGVANVVWHLF